MSNELIQVKKSLVLEPLLLKTRDLPEAWFQCIWHLLFEPQYSYIYKIDSGSKKGQYRLEFKDITVHVVFPGTEPLLPDVPLGVPLPADAKMLDDYMPYIFTDAKHPDEEYTYGQDLTWQAEWCIKHYKEEGLGTNHCYMTVGRPEALRNYERPGGTTQCLRGIDTKIVAGQLHFRIYYRSWDLWGALSMNLAAFELLKQYMASQIGVENGCMIFASKGLHIYDESWKYAAERCQKPLPEYLEKILEQKRQETE